MIAFNVVPELQESLIIILFIIKVEFQFSKLGKINTFI